MVKSAAKGNKEVDTLEIQCLTQLLSEDMQMTNRLTDQSQDQIKGWPTIKKRSFVSIRKNWQNIQDANFNLRTNK